HQHRHLHPRRVRGGPPRADPARGLVDRGPHARTRPRRGRHPGPHPDTHADACRRHGRRVMATVQPGEVRRGRGRELILLVLAVVLGLGAYASVSLAVEESLPADFYAHSGVLVLLAVVLHLLVRYFAPYADPVILPVAVALNGVGLAMIHRLD